MNLYLTINKTWNFEESSLCLYFLTLYDYVPKCITPHSVTRVILVPVTSYDPVLLWTFL